jgi:hypothetical protein
MSHCTACSNRNVTTVKHSLLNIPVCLNCNESYHTGEFLIDEDGNETYCRWCGEGGKLCLCDSCPKSFCCNCLERNFGVAEALRILNLSDRWNCLICSPQPLYDLCKKRGWEQKSSAELPTSKRFKQSKGLVCADISRGRERFAIPAINEVDEEAAPLDFVYVTAPAAGKNVTLSNNPSFLTCCSCTDNCKDPKKCECALLMNGFAYNSDGILIKDKIDGIYECNQRCSCHISRCKNRVVGNGPTLRLEVFRCSNPIKGWGVRCSKNIDPGTYIADYLGEILQESDADGRGLALSDEYLFTLDHFGRGQACQRLVELNMKKNILKIPREIDMNVTVMNKNDLKKYLDVGLVDLLEHKGAINRGNEIGKNRFLNDKEQNVNRNLLLQSTKNNKPLNKNNAVANKKNVQNILQIKVDNNNNNNNNKSSNNSNNNSNNIKNNENKKLENSINNIEKNEKETWMNKHLLERLELWNNARNIITDRVVLETEEKHETFIIDAKLLLFFH